MVAFGRQTPCRCGAVTRHYTLELLKGRGEVDTSCTAGKRWEVPTRCRRAAPWASGTSYPFWGHTS